MIEVIVKTANEEKPFPKLMIAKELIVYFTESRKGNFINGSESYSFNEYRTDWFMHNFTDYNEEITLTIKNKHD